MKESSFPRVADMHFSWRPDWTCDSHIYEGHPRCFNVEVRDDSLAVLLSERQALGGFIQMLLKLAATASTQEDKEATRRHQALRQQAMRFMDFEQIRGLVVEGADPAADETVLFHPDALPDDAALRIGLWRASVAILESWIEARQILDWGRGGIDVHEMMLGAAIERVQRLLEAKVARHVFAAGYPLEVNVHIEASLLGEGIRIVLLRAPTRRAADSLID